MPPAQKMLVDYDKLLIRCKACQNWTHKVSDCKEIQKRLVRGVRRPPRAYNTYHQEKEKGKNIVLD